MENKISVIIPVYNGEKYIKRCIESVVNQEYKNIEIIIVNNASTDKTVEKIQEIKDNRIKIFTLEEKGVSNARNFGIDKATGEYIIFIDSDDWLEKDMLLFMMDKIKTTKCDMIRVNYFINKVTKKNYCEGNLDKKYKNKEITEVMKKELIKDIIISNIGAYLWVNLIKKDIIIKNNIYFDKDIYRLEDKIFIIKLILKCNKICFYDKPLYHYFYNTSSTMHNKEFEKNILNDIIVNERVNNILKNGYENLINYNNVVSIKGIEEFIFFIFMDKGKKETIEFCKKLEQNKQFVSIINNYEEKYFSIFKKYNINRVRFLKERKYDELIKLYYILKIKYKIKNILRKIKTIIKNNI